MKNILSLLATTFVVAVLLITVGCSGKPRPDGMPKLYPCTVKITQNGQPLEGASVAFFSDSKWGVAGTTDSSGVAKMYTYGDYPGAPEGSYAVTVEKTTLDAGGVDLSALSPSVTPTVTAIDVVDVKYKNKDTTDLKLDVKGKTTAEFEIGEAVSEEVKKL